MTLFDDIFVLWTSTMLEVNEFEECLNKIQSLIQFTVTENPIEICFLDVKVQVTNKLDTML